MMLLRRDDFMIAADPVNRREAWRLIQRMKVGRAMILTVRLVVVVMESLRSFSWITCLAVQTHSMAEADCLGDRVAIMGHGNVVAVGTPLKLKNRYGSGYRLSLMSSVGRLSELMRHVHSVIPVAAVSRKCVVVLLRCRFARTLRSATLGAVLRSQGCWQCHSHCTAV